MVRRIDWQGETGTASTSLSYMQCTGCLRIVLRTYTPSGYVMHTCLDCRSGAIAPTTTYGGR